MTDLHRIQTHARSILEGEGQDEHDPALVEAVARGLLAKSEDDFRQRRVWMNAASSQRWRAKRDASLALSTIRKHEESRHDG